MKKMANEGIWDEGVRWEPSHEMVFALKALGLGYFRINIAHGRYLLTFGLCISKGGFNGFEITSAGRRALELWERGLDYDCGTPDGTHPSKARDAPA